VSDGRQEPFELAEEAAAAIADRTGVARHDVAVVLGSGWAAAADELGDVVADVELADLPGFPAPTVAGHRNLARSVRVGDTAALVLGGRAHLYEGHPVTTVVHGVRTAIAAGCSTIILTNAAGGLNPAWPVGQPVLLSDHLNLTGTSPMVGPSPPPDKPIRFVDLTEAYSPRLRDLAREVDPDLPEGVYAALLGGAFETPAEIRMLAGFGADLVGMSTALEAIAARHLGAEVLGVSLVTNAAAGLSDEALDHSDVLEAAGDAGPRMVALLRGVVERL
jgi:purine-nucleoside phosphorylase